MLFQIDDGLACIVQFISEKEYHKFVDKENISLNFDTSFVNISWKVTELLAQEDTIPWFAETRQFAFS